MFNNRPAKPRLDLASIHSILSSMPSDTSFTTLKMTSRSSQLRSDIAAHIVEVLNNMNAN